MTRFCKHCGNALSAEMAFCDACGQPVANKEAPPPVATTTVPGKRSVPRALLLGGAAVLILLLTGSAVFFLMPGSEPPTGAALARLLNADKTFVQDKICLDNFDYAADPVHVSSWDERTQQWLQVLVDAGLYTTPERIVSNRGFFSQTQLRYTQTPAAKEAIRNGKLCFATDLAVTNIQYAPQQQQNDMHLVRGELSYGYTQAAPWITTPEAKAMQPDRFGQDSHQTVIYLGKQGSEDWKLLSQAEARRLERQMAAATITRAESGSVWKLTEIFSGLFQSHPAGPIMGKWGIEKNSTEVHFEFMPDAMVTDGKTMAVNYVVNGKAVTVQSGTPRHDVLAIAIVSDNELSLETVFGKVPLYRVR